MFIKTCLILLLFPCLISTKSVILTDKTWGDMLHGEWLVEFYAPWCGACKQFGPVWNEVSEVMASKNIKVAAVDVDQYPSLSGRFRISALPTVYHVRDGVFRQYNGIRSLQSLKTYIENEDWKKTEPISSYYGPNSILMSFVSSVFDISVFVKDGHALLKDYYGWPSWVIYTIFAIGVVSLGILLGFGFLQIIDYFISDSSKADANTVSEDTDESEEDDSQKLLRSKTETTDENQDDEVLISDGDDNSDEEQQQQQITTDQTVRQRQLKK